MSRSSLRLAFTALLIAAGVLTQTNTALAHQGGQGHHCGSESSAGFSTGQTVKVVVPPQQQPLISVEIAPSDGVVIAAGEPLTAGWTASLALDGHLLLEGPTLVAPLVVWVGIGQASVARGSFEVLGQFPGIPTRQRIDAAGVVFDVTAPAQPVPVVWSDCGTGSSSTTWRTFAPLLIPVALVVVLLAVGAWRRRQPTVM